MKRFGRSEPLGSSAIKDAPAVDAAIAGTTNENLVGRLASEFSDDESQIANRLPQRQPEGGPNLEWALREVYQQLPLSQCVELEDHLFILPKAVRDLLPADRKELRRVLDTYPGYFAVWSYPDNPTIAVIQRARLPFAPMTDSMLAARIAPMVPQGGITFDRLLRKVSPLVQRYLYRNGLQTVLKRMPGHFLIAGGKVLKVAVDP